MTLPAPTTAEWADRVRAGERVWTARAISLVESTRPADRDPARRLLAALTPHSGGAYRIGVTGPPGAGKSTFIDALGSHLTGLGHRVAVLAVDPSSVRSGGSILGDRTRMGRLGAHPHAFIRPSPSAGTLGGTAAATREAMIVVEAAGFDVVLVETVGVGQSETAVSRMVDAMLLLTVARTGDALQGIKRGVLEHADLVVVNKTDGPHADESRRAARELAGALRLADGAAAVLACSAVDGAGIPDVWERLCDRRSSLLGSGELDVRRRAQLADWTAAAVQERLLSALRSHAGAAAVAADLREEVARGALSPAEAADRIVAAFLTP